MKQKACDFLKGADLTRLFLQVKIVESLSSYFGDPTTSNVILKTFDVDEAKVVWYNKSLAYVACDDPHIKWVTNQMLLPDGKIRPRFIQHFEQYLQVILKFFCKLIFRVPEHCTCII